jgi:hypothetical protein
VPLAENSAVGPKVGISPRGLRHLSQLSLFSDVFKRLHPDFASFVSVKFCSNPQVMRFIVYLCDLWTI